jgi:hypothetical protein
MPAGPGPMGFVYFAAAKFVGYTAFCHWVVNPAFVNAGTHEVRTDVVDSGRPFSDASPATDHKRDAPLSVKAGVVRTLIGLAVGAAVGLGFWTIPYFSTHDTAGTVLFFALLVPVRVGEWALLFWWIYGMRPFKEALGWKLITFGLLVSFALDAVGIIAAFVFPGGMWVC